MDHHLTRELVDSAATRTIDRSGVGCGSREGVPKTSDSQRSHGLQQCANGGFGLLTVPVYPLSHYDVLLLVLDILKRVGERADLLLDRSRLPIVRDVDHSMHIEPAAISHQSDHGRVVGSVSSNIETDRHPERARARWRQTRPHDRSRDTTRAERARTYETVFGDTVLISFEKQYWYRPSRTEVKV
jgi:hypothetical protein